MQHTIYIINYQDITFNKAECRYPHLLRATYIHLYEKGCPDVDSTLYNIFLCGVASALLVL